MKVLLDEHLTHDLRALLQGHDVYTVHFMKWDGVSNGFLLAKAAGAGFDVLVTNDAGFKSEQNRATLPCSVVYLNAPSNAPEVVTPLAPKLLRALKVLQPRSFLDLSTFD